MPVVSNTSPLFNLAAIGKLSLLRHAFAEILITEAVLAVRECPGVQAIHDAIAQGWIVVRVPQDVSKIRILEQDLGRGEAAAIALALELRLALKLRTFRVCLPRSGTLSALRPIQQQGRR